MEEDGELHAVLITGVTVNDDTMETVKVIDPEDNEGYSVFVRPIYNCRDMDNEELGKRN